MKASANWLRTLLDHPISSEEIARLLTRGGLEVEGITRHGQGLEHVVIAEVRGHRPHPKKDKVTLVTVFDGVAEHEVVCGANNVPDPASRPAPRVLYARLGAKLPNGITIAARDVGGVVSNGMLCSEAELSIGSDGDGIVVLSEGDPGRPGEPIAEALQLLDEVLELSVTPNRPDALGHLGLARELAAHLGRPFAPRLPQLPQRMLSETPPIPSKNRGLPLVEEGTVPQDTLSMFEPAAGVAQAVPIRIESPERCARYLGLVIENVAGGRTPFSWRYRLYVLGLRSIGPVVDATNWMLALSGNPVHAFDLEKLEGPEITVRTARDGEIFSALDGTEHRLAIDDLVIADASGPVALAGVMGGLESSVTPLTKHVMLEVAYFDPRSVRRTARRHGFHTDSSHRFERGVDPSALERVMRTLSATISELTSGAPSPTIVDCTADAALLAPRAIALDPSFVSQVIGSDIAVSESRQILESLGCTVSPGAERGLRVVVPGHRPDLRRAIDLVEEVVRMRGYDRLESRLLHVSSEGRVPRPRLSIVRRIRAAAAAAGLYEALSHSLLTARDLSRARVPASEVLLLNPISEERAVLRTSLLPGLLSAVLRAERRGDRRVRLFECARVYLAGDARVPGDVPVREDLELCAVLAGPRDGWLGTEERVDFWDGKGVLSAIGASLSLELTVSRDGAPTAAYLHPQRSAHVLMAGQSIGFLGELHPDVSDEFQLVAPPVVLCLDAEALIRAQEAHTPRAVPAMPRFPSVERDLAIVVDASVEAGKVAEVLRESAPLLVEDVVLFDVYTGKPVPEGKKSLAFRIAYRDREATLTDAKVDALHQSLLSRASSTFGAELRS